MFPLSWKARRGIRRGFLYAFAAMLLFEGIIAGSVSHDIMDVPIVRLTREGVIAGAIALLFAVFGVGGGIYLFDVIKRGVLDPLDN